jgi:hypothetical protein
MRTEYINSLVVYFDDDEIVFLKTLSDKLKKQAHTVGLKKQYTPDEREIIEKIYDLFDRADDKPNSQTVTVHSQNLIPVDDEDEDQSGHSKSR